MKYLLTAAALIAATACTDATAPSALRPGSGLKDSDFNQTDPSALASSNPCNNDAVELAGTLHTLIHSTDAGSGNQHIYTDFTGSYSGLGEPSGATYQGSTRTLNDFTTNNPYPIVTDFFQDIVLISNGSAPNYTLRIHVKLTINANGVPTADVEDFSETCTG